MTSRLHENRAAMPLSVQLSGADPVLEVPTSIHLDVDLDAPGKHAGNVRFPHSPDHDAWGAELVPIVSIKGGEGPVVLAEAGNHGDEYEGALTRLDLARGLDPAEVRGQLTCFPWRTARPRAWASAARRWTG